MEMTARPPLLVRAVSGLGTSVIGGGALGAGAWLSDQLSWPVSLLIPANAIGAWLAVAFILGASARTVPTGALRGLVGLLAAVAAYYSLFALFGNGFRAIGAGHAATIWGAVALAAGPILGAAGAVWRHRAGLVRGIAVACLAAPLIAEGVVFGGPRFLQGRALTTDPTPILLAVEILVGILGPFVLLRRGERWAGYAATVVASVASALAIGPVIGVIRSIANRF